MIKNKKTHAHSFHENRRWVLALVIGIATLFAISACENGDDYGSPPPSDEYEDSFEAPQPEPTPDDEVN